MAATERLEALYDGMQIIKKKVISLEGKMDSIEKKGFRTCAWKYQRLMLPLRAKQIAT